MRSHLIAAVVTIAASAGLSHAPAPAMAASLGSTATLATPVLDQGATPVRYRGRPYYGRSYYGRPNYYHRRRSRSAAPAIIGGVILGAIIAEAIREGRASNSAMQMCADRFRSFDPGTGTYVTYGGEVRVCPYLR